MIAARLQKPAPRLRAALVLATALVVAASGMAAAAGDDEIPGDPLAGRSIFVEKGCSHCHAIWKEGGTLGPDLGRHGVWLSVMQLAGVLWNHSPAMIEKMRERRMVRPKFTADEMADLIAFLYYLNYFDPPGNADQGKRLFSERTCSTCHSVGGSGGSLGPALDSYKRFASPLFLARTMWSHGPAMEREMRERNLPRPQLLGRDIGHLSAYIQRDGNAPNVEKVYMVPGSPARGKLVFDGQHCTQCHAVQGAGAAVGPDLGAPDIRRTVTETAALMWNHQPEMWEEARAMDIAPPEFTDQQLSDLIAYVFFLQYLEAPGDIEKGEAVYNEKDCVMCHDAASQAGERFVVDLSASPALKSSLELTAAMWNHAPAMEEHIQTLGLAWPRFRNDEVRDLVSYLRSLARVPDAR